jgi:hypothetical protein
MVVESRMVASRVWEKGERGGGYHFLGTEFLFLTVESVLAMDGGKAYFNILRKQMFINEKIKKSHLRV